MKILHKYVYGSHVYKTTTKDSDIDTICIVSDEDLKAIKQKDYKNSDNIDRTFLTKTMFQTMLDNHEIIAMECYFMYKPKEFTFTLDKNLLRSEISKVSSNSWQKAYKKLTVMSDYDKHLAIKSIYHSIRILSFGIQLCTHGKIVDFTENSWLLLELKILVVYYDNIELWSQIKSKYEALYKTLRTNFRKLAPKAKEKFNIMDFLIDYTLKNSETNVDEKTFKIRKDFAKQILNYIK